MKRVYIDTMEKNISIECTTLQRIEDTLFQWGPNLIDKDVFPKLGK